MHVTNISSTYTNIATNSLICHVIWHFQYLINYFCVDLSMFWYDFELFLNNWYLGSLISFMLEKGCNWNNLLLKKLPSHKLKCASGISHQSLHLSGKETKNGSEFIKQMMRSCTGSLRGREQFQRVCDELLKKSAVSFSATSPRARTHSAGAVPHFAVADPCNKDSTFRLPLFC